MTRIAVQRLGLIGAATAWVMAAQLAVAQPAPPAGDTGAQPSAPSATLGEGAEQLLRALSQTLAGAPTVALDMSAMREVQLADGRIATLLSDVTLALRRPDRLRADIRGDAVLADVYYDGHKITVHAIPQAAFAQVDAPPTLDETITLLEERLGVPLELGNLLMSDAYSRLAPGTTGDIVSRTEVSGRPAWHLLLRSGDTDWELWIDQSDLPLPLLAVIHRNGRRTLLRFDEWRLGADIAENLFQFSPPPGVRAIPFAVRSAGGVP